MRKFLKNRVLPFVCAFSILISLCVVPASAASGIGYDDGLDPGAVSDWTSAVSNPISDLVAVLAKRFGCEPTGHLVFWKIMDGVLGNNVGEVSRAELEQICGQINSWFGGNPVSDLYSDVISQAAVYGGKTLSVCMGLANVHFEVMEDSPTAGYMRIQDTVSGYWLVNSKGQFPCVAKDESEEGQGSDQWVPIGYMGKGSFRMMSFDALYNLADDVGGKLIKYNNYYCIKKSSTSAIGDLVYANADGKPYVCPYENDKWASNQDRPTTSVKDEVGEIVEGVIEGITPGINLDNMTVTLPDGTVNIIDELIYDESTKSYTIDSHDTYNTTNNYYLEWNYEWNYYINFTSITYIGQTEQYDKYYEVYYELPDGRDSADLSKEDLEQLNLSIDVIPYGRSADDTSLRSLYHFDGDTKDSSYWNYCTDFTWNKGASLTYMEAGAFEGALYLDETEHDFTIQLPSSIGTGDFTVQFRYYQSHTLAPQTDSYVAVGTRKIMQFTGSRFVTHGGVEISSTSTGTWNEVAVTRSGGNVYWYVNGVPYVNGTGLGSVYMGDTITFHFGSGQQTYKYFDELRVLNYAIAAGDNYTPTSVPHDTNLSLVLPDSAVPVADEYWEITSSGENLFQYDMDDGASNGFVGISPTVTIGYNNYETGQASETSMYALSQNSTAFAFPKWGFNQHYVSAVVSSEYVTFTAQNDYLFGNYTVINANGKLTVNNNFWVGSALATLLSRADNTKATHTAYLADGSYLLSVVMEDGSICSYPFTMSGNKPTASNFVDFDWGSIGIAYADSYTPSSSSYRTYPAYYLYIQPNVNTPVSIRHIELIKGAETDLKAEFISSIVPIDKDSLNTPTLAVRTDEEITSHIIGGPRPSLPEKGMVWALVENERITSLQVYNGQAWEAVDGRIWTGERWVPYNAYNIITLQDMYDIVDATPDFEYIYSESGFWTWWQKSWNAFQERLFKALESGGGSGGATLDPETAPTVPIDPDTGEEGYTILELFVVLKDGTWKLISGVVSTAYDGFSGFVQTVSDAGNFFDFYDSDSEESIFFIPLEEGETIWD